MGSIFSGAVLAALFFVTFLFLLLSGLRKRRRNPIYFSLIFLLMAVGAGVFTSYLLISKTYSRFKNVKVDNPFKMRSGDEVYNVLFGTPADKCVQIINLMDQVVPRLDCCIWLEFKTCPAEIKRIVARKPYQKKVYYVADSAGYMPNYTPRPDWFKPAILGDSIIELRHYDAYNPNRDQILFLSKDSSHALYCDMAD